MRHLAFVLLLLALAALEATVPRLFLLDAARPLLVLPLVLYFALKLNTVEGAVLSLVGGFAMDATAGYPTGLATFTMVALFVTSRLVLVGLRADGRIFEAIFTFGLAGCFHALTFLLTRVFGPAAAQGSVPQPSSMLLSALVTAAVSPLVFAPARRIERIQPKQAGML